jgi:hypothetical protein
MLLEYPLAIDTVAEGNTTSLNTQAYIALEVLARDLVVASYKLCF